MGSETAGVSQKVSLCPLPSLPAEGLCTPISITQVMSASHRPSVAGNVYHYLLCTDNDDPSEFSHFSHTRNTSETHQR